MWPTGGGVVVFSGAADLAGPLPGTCTGVLTREMVFAEGQGDASGYPQRQPQPGRGGPWGGGPMVQSGYIGMYYH